MKQHRAILLWGVVLIVMFMLSALPVAWASPTQDHGRFTVPTRTPTGSPPTQVPTQEPTNPPPTQGPTSEPPSTQEPTQEPQPTQEQPTEEPTVQPSPTGAPTNTPLPRTATATPHSSSGTHTRTLPATPTGTPSPTVELTLTPPASPTPREIATTLTPTSTVEMDSDLDNPVPVASDSVTGVLSGTAETMTATGSGLTETLMPATSVPVITSSQPSALVVTSTPSDTSPEGGGRQRISPLFLGGLAAIVLGVLVWFVGKRWGSSPTNASVSESDSAALGRGGMPSLGAERSEALPPPASDAYKESGTGKDS